MVRLKLRVQSFFSSPDKLVDGLARKKAPEIVNLLFSQALRWFVQIACIVLQPEATSESE